MALPIGVSVGALSNQVEITGTPGDEEIALLIRMTDTISVPKGKGASMEEPDDRIWVKAIGSAHER